MIIVGVIKHETSPSQRVATGPLPDTNPKEVDRIKRELDNYFGWTSIHIER